MGQDISISDNVNVITNHVTLIEGNVKENKLMTKYRMLYNKSPREQILSIAVNDVPISKESDVAIIFCNSYYKTKYDLGDSAINDGLLCYEKFKEYGYDTYILYDTTSTVFNKVLFDSVKCNYNKLTIYFIGHGTQIRDKNGDELDNKDECLVFKDKLVVDDDIAKIINENNKCKRLTLMTDCCHSGTIYDVEPCEDIITISACKDTQTAKQDWINHKGNGVFTYYFWKYLPECDDSKKLSDKINIKLKKYSQTCVFSHHTNTII